MASNKDTLVIESAEQLWQPGSRREFLRLLGIGGSLVLLPGVFAACDDDDDPIGTGGGAVTLNLGNDTGILNYAYALEQLEAAFYTAVVASSTFASLSAEIQEVMVDLRNHEVIHRDFLAQVIGANARIPNLSLNAGTVTTATANRDAILRTAEQFEDLGVAAYNGAGKYLATEANLLVAGKIVSVEARHAAAIRDIRESLGATGPGRFAGDDVVDAQGLDVKMEPAAVLARVETTTFVTTDISVGTNPNGTATTDAPTPTTV